MVVVAEVEEAVGLSPHRLTVLVYHPFPLTRAGIRRWLATHPELPAAVAAETGELDELVRLAGREWVDLLIFPAGVLRLVLHRAALGVPPAGPPAGPPAAAPPADPAAASVFTQTDIRTLALLAVGATQAEAAAALGIAYGSMKARVARILDHARARSIAHAAALAWSAGALGEIQLEDAAACLARTRQERRARAARQAAAAPAAQAGAPGAPAT